MSMISPAPELDTPSSGSPAGMVVASGRRAGQGRVRPAMPSFRNAVAIMSDPLAPARPPSRPPVRHTPPSPPDAKTPAWMPSNRELKILLLEDAQDDAELIVHTLRKGGLVFGSRRVQTRQALVEAFIEFHPDIIVVRQRAPWFRCRNGNSNREHRMPGPADRDRHRDARR